MTAFFEIINDKIKATTGTYKWGITITTAYLPLDNSDFFNTDMKLVDWLAQYSPDTNESFGRAYLARMLFSGEEALKKANDASNVVTDKDVLDVSITNELYQTNNTSLKITLSTDVENVDFSEEESSVFSS